MPSDNVLESKHESMRAASGYAQQFSLFFASSTNLAMPMLQSAPFKACLTGRHERSAPCLLQLRNRFPNGEDGVTPRK